MKRAVQLLMLLLGVIFTPVPPASAADYSTTSPLATTFLPSMVGLPETSPDIRIEPADGPRIDGDGSGADWLPNIHSPIASVPDRVGGVAHTTSSVPLSEHTAATNQARAPPAV